MQRLVLPTDETEETPERLSLAPIGGAPFSLDATLDTVGVVDGDLLALQPIPVGPPAPRIVEDIADAAVIFSAARERPWGAAHIQRAATVAVIALILVATGLAVAHRVATGEALGLFTVGGLAAATVLGALLSRVRSPRLATALGITALVPLAAALALAVPGDFGGPQMLLAAAGVIAWSIISITLGERAIAVFTATAVTGSGVLLAAAASVLWDAFDHRARLRADRGGTLGDGAGRRAVGAVGAVPVAGHSRTRRPDTVGAATAGARGSAPPCSDQRFAPDGASSRPECCCAVTGSARARRPADASPWAWYVVVAAAAGATLRARVWDSAPCKAWLLSQSYLLRSSSW